MGTRGLFAFLYKGKYYVFYNQFDSYFSGLGDKLLSEIKKAIDDGDIDQWKDQLLGLKAVNGYDILTEEDFNRVKDVLHTRHEEPHPKSCMHGTMRCCHSYVDALKCGIYDKTLSIDDHEEYTYILDFDNNTFTGERIYDSKSFCFSFDEIAHQNLLKEYDNNDGNDDDDNEYEDNNNEIESSTEDDDKLWMMKTQVKN
jgi:hypothetical protein